MGTDELGRDTLARIIHGAQVSLQVGLISVSIAFVGGVLFGLLAGYYRGTLDTVLMRLVDIMFSLPGIVLAIVIAGLLGPESPQRDDRDRDRHPAGLRPGHPRHRSSR